MKILNLEEAAALLKMTPEGLRRKVVKGEIPGAKPGKCWCFIEEDLAQYLQSMYPSYVKELCSVIKPSKKMTIRHSTKETMYYGLPSNIMEKEYSEALGLTTK